jgi:cytochrome b pre-mRNA-processing protein 3
MLTWLRSRSLYGKTATALYGSIVTQSRIPAFYLLGGVPDTMEGRFNVIAVHMFLVLERIRQGGDDALARALLETLMTDMDDSLREIGIGDMGVPRRVKKAAAALHEHLDAYRAAFTQDYAEPLAAAVARYAIEAPDVGDPHAIAGYMRSAATQISAQSWSEISAGNIRFPDFPSAATASPGRIHAN